MLEEQRGKNLSGLLQLEQLNRKHVHFLHTHHYYTISSRLAQKIIQALMEEDGHTKMELYNSAINILNSSVLLPPITLLHSTVDDTLRFMVEVWWKTIPRSVVLTLTNSDASLAMMDDGHLFF